MLSNRTQEYHPGSIETGMETQPTRRTQFSGRDGYDGPEGVHLYEESSLIHQSDDEELSFRDTAEPHRRFGLLSTTFLMCVGVLKL